MNMKINNCFSKSNGDIYIASFPLEFYQFLIEVIFNVLSIYKNPQKEYQISFIDFVIIATFSFYVCTFGCSQP